MSLEQFTRNTVTKPLLWDICTYQHGGNIFTCICHAGRSGILPVAFSMRTVNNGQWLHYQPTYVFNITDSACTLYIEMLSFIVSYIPLLP